MEEFQINKLSTKKEYYTRHSTYEGNYINKISRADALSKLGLSEEKDIFSH